MTRRTDRRYLPALGYHWATRFYDPLVRLTLPEVALKKRLLKQARIGPEHTVVDVGCGTGTLLLMVEDTYRPRRAIGLDGDAKVLRMAASKARRSVAQIGLVQGFSYDLPFTDGAFDRVLSSFTFHHLTGPDKRSTLSEIVRILRPGGELHVADWGRPHNLLMRILSISVRIGDGLQRTADNLQGRLPELFRQAGLADVRELSRSATVFGTLSMYRARKPGVPS